LFLINYKRFLQVTNMIDYVFKKWVTLVSIPHKKTRHFKFFVTFYSTLKFKFLSKKVETRKKKYFIDLRNSRNNLFFFHSFPPSRHCFSYGFQWNCFEIEFFISFYELNNILVTFGVNLATGLIFIRFCA